VAVDPMPMIHRLSLSLALPPNWGIRVESQSNGFLREITHVKEKLVSKHNRQSAGLRPSLATKYLLVWLQESEGNASSPRCLPHKAQPGFE
jgi:hypothetical protein